MFLPRKIISCYSKCYSPLKCIYRTAKMSHRKKYIKERTKESNSPGVQLQVIGSGAADQPAIIALNTVDRCYLFNCGEGIGRHCQDVKINLKRISNIFFTQTKWNCIGGVTSVIFATICNTGYPPKFHGPGNLHKIIQRMVYLSSVGGLFEHRFNSDSFFTAERFEDKRLIVEPIQLRCGKETAMLYVCKLNASQGTFSLKKSVDKNVPATLLPQLFNGETVRLDDGTIITASECRYPDMPEVNMIFIDVPDIGFLLELQNNKKLTNLLDETKSTGIDLIIHFTPEKVVKTVGYQHVIEKIGAKQHLVVNDSNKHSTMETVHRLQNKLHKIDPKLHPRLSMKLNPNPKIFTPNVGLNGKFDETSTLCTTYVFREQPDDWTGIQSEAIPYENIATEEFNQILAAKDDGVEDDDADNRLMHAQSVPLKLTDEQFPRFLFLGTSSADSYLLRNSTGILVHLSKDHSILLDCGTAICTQINRFYGDEAPEIYRRLKAVYVSHMHLDHHIGLPALLQWRQLHLPRKREPLRIFCPVFDFRSWFGFYSNHVDSIESDIKYIDNDYLLEDGLIDKERTYLNINSMVTCPVKHYRKSYALSMTFPYQNGDKHELFKLAYSGDTGLCDAFVKSGQNADLLIHEATFPNELEETANRFNHSTLSMAIEQAQKMHAKHTILTHFSARYSILPDIREPLNDSIGIAFDYMEVMPSDLPRLNGLIAKYKEAFPENDDSIAQKTKRFSLHLNEKFKPVEFQ